MRLKKALRHIGKTADLLKITQETKIPIIEQFEVDV